MNQKKFPFLQICKVGFTYVGAVIGAGFASGKEIFEFFIRYGTRGVLGIGLAGILFVLGGIVFLQLAKRIGVQSYFQIFYKLLGKKMGYVVDVIYILFILGSISVMLAGSGTIFQDVLNLNYSYGVLATLIIVLLTIFTGVQGILVFNSLLIPVLTIVIIITSLVGLGEINGLILSTELPMIPWYMSAMMYVAFNIFMSLAILSMIGSEESDQKVLIWGGVFGGVLLTVILLMMSMVMFNNLQLIIGAEMPMLTIATLSGSSTLHLSYIIGLWFAMITTAVASVYAFIQRVIPLLGLSGYNAAMLTVIVVLPLTRFGFANLVTFLYPIYGIVTLLVLGMMGWGWRKEK